MIEKRSETILLGGVGLAVGCLAMNLALRSITHLGPLDAVLPYPVLSAVVCLMVWFRMRLHRLAEQERQDEAIAQEETVSGRLFDSDGEAAPFTASRNASQFEKFGIFLFAPVLAVVEALWAWRLLGTLREAAPAEEPERILLAAALLGGQAFLLFLYSRFMLGLARNANQRLLRGPGVMLGMTCLAVAVLGVATIVGDQLYARAPRLAAWGLAGFLALLALEHLLNFIGEVYRPRRGARAQPVAYESRLGGLLTDPASWVNNMAQALDYQFGFNVSHTWFYRFLQGALLPLVVFQLLVLYFLSSLVFIGPEEVGIRERFGRPLESGWELDSGVHLKWPWPFETVRRFPAKRILDIHIGYEAGPEHGLEGAILWGNHPQENEGMFLVATQPSSAAGDGTESVPVSLLNVHFPVEYRITNVFQYAYGFADPRQVLKESAYRSFSLQAAGSDLFSIMATGQEDTVQRLREDIQATADELGLGVEIVFIGLQGVHPPAEVVPAFESVIGAREEKEAIQLKAATYAAETLPTAEADGQALRMEADAYRFSRAELVGAEIDRFQQQVKGYEASPDVYRTRWYLRTLRDSIADARKYIVSASPDTEVIELNLEEPINPDMFDLGTSEVKGHTP